MMFKLELQNKKSIYEQIIDGYKGMILSGELQPGSKILSVRELSELLTVNPNTVQKAYRALEQQGWIFSVAGRGNFVAEEKHRADEKVLNDLFTRIGVLIDELYYLGIGKTEICDSIQGLIEERGKRND